MSTRRLCRRALRDASEPADAVDPDGDGRDLLPVHFKRNGFPNGWQYKTLWRVLMPLFVQAALASTLASMAMLLLSRSDLAGPDTPVGLRVDRDGFAPVRPDLSAASS